MSTVSILMQSNFDYSDDYFYPDGQEPRKVYASKAAAQAQCDQLNVQSWTHLNVSTHWPYGPQPLETQDPQILRRYEREVSSNLFSDVETTDDEHFYDSRVSPDDQETDLATPMWGEESRAISPHDEEPSVEMDAYFEADYDKSSYAEKDIYTEFPEEEAALSSEEGKTFESERTYNYSLETLHQKLTEILGPRMGKPWTEMVQWDKWRVPQVTPNEVAGLSRLFGLVFYRVVEVEMEEVARQ